MKDFIILSIVILLLDTVYLSNFGAKPFLNMVEKIQNEKTVLKFSAAGMAYILLILAMHQFVIKDPSNYQKAFILGIIIYGVFDATNMAIFNKYDYAVAIQDTLWGGILFAISLYLYNQVIIKYNNL